MSTIATTPANPTSDSQPATAPRRLVSYPSPLGKSADAATHDVIAQRLARLATLDYHSVSRPPPKPIALDGTVERLASASGGGTSAVTSNITSPPTALNNAPAPDDKPVDEVCSKLPVSIRGRTYFSGSVIASGPSDGEPGGDTDRLGIVIIDVAAGAAQFIDKEGRQYGNRPAPGYFLKGGHDAAAQLTAGATIRIGTKSVSLLTALHEDAFRTGEFFLHSEHVARKKEEKRKAVAQAQAIAARIPKIHFGSGFQARVFRRRPQPGEGGFVVPVAGRPKTDRQGRILGTTELRPLHDPDREGAVVLFRADYKKYQEGRPIVSVVVDPVIGDKLRPHQKIGVQFLFDCVTGRRMPGYHGAILADEMGLGKTIQTVATVWTCLKQGPHGQPVSPKVIVVAPCSLVRNWCNEFDKWLGVGAVKCFSIAESTPKGDRILSRFESEGEVLVISYDQLRKYIDRLKESRLVDLVVCDEGHRLKNAEIKTARAVDMLPTRRRIVLSGTPIQNDLSEFHAMVGFVNGGILGSSDVFNRIFEVPIMSGRDPKSDDDAKELGADRAHYLSNMTAKFILRRTQTINEKYLPPKVDLTVFCRLGVEQRMVYERVAAAYADFSSAPLVLISAMKKLCNHVDLLHDAISAEGSQLRLPRSVLPRAYQPGTLNPSYGSKLDFVARMLEEITSNGSHDKVVIVSNYTQTLDIIARLCDVRRVAFFQLDGSTPIKRRQELVDRFNVPTQREIVFLLSSKAGGVGLNLIGANRLILFDPDWNPANDAQAMGRVWRDGQKKKVFIYRLLSTGCIEEKIYQRQVSKSGLSANVVDMKEDSKQHFTLDELKSLFVYRPDTACDTHDLLGCRCLAAAAAGASAGQRGDAGQPLKMAFRAVGKGAAATGGPRMDELKSWMHLRNVAEFTLDPVIARIAQRQPDLISFAFANERDAQKLTNSLTEERPFAQDEAAVTMGSQPMDRGVGPRRGADDDDDDAIAIVASDDDDDESDASSSDD